ncbi:heterodimeric geranylgeranyl pyrophosphate synthase small subunit, chloroplastic-like [Andrographis paniculata]|uniref:heterodimeric geranylgeranyl pyrophosphate synthase small subunit, chloroplastic-like n=1 Tax=Andrographis paniculata TaxID=175694 RepID=UPI0021E80E8B|nr:heterodimeric geranylgeranyl pyrophosphate synthase small subunit, chloroplastic-like [Andrographis paniculata]
MASPGLCYFNSSLPNLNSTRIFARSNNPKNVVVESARSYWTSMESEIEAYLKKAALSIRSPESVSEPMHHLTFAAAPRTTAPALCLAACELMSAKPGPSPSPAVLAAATAIHLVHAAAHVHAHLRRTGVGHRFGPNVELLIGDGMVPLGMELLRRSMDPEDPNGNGDLILRVMAEIARAGGARGVVDGVYSSDIARVCGELHACGAACGAILSGAADHEDVERLRRFGRYVGMAQGSRQKKRSESEYECECEYAALARREIEWFQDRKKIHIADLMIDAIIDLSYNMDDYYLDRVWNIN